MAVLRLAGNVINDCYCYIEGYNAAVWWIAVSKL